MLSELSSPGMRFEIPVSFGVSGALGRRSSREPPGTRRDGRIGTDVEFGRLLGVPELVVARMERDAVGPDGERYEWTRIYVGEYGRGRLMSLCEFEVDDEDAAFAYAEEQMRATSSRLAVTNRSCASVQKLARAMRAHDVDDVSGFVSDDLCVRRQSTTQR